MGDFDTLMVGSYALTAVGYALLAALTTRHYVRVGRDPIASAVSAAALVTCAWALTGTAFGPASDPLVAAAYEYFDVLRYGAWFAVLISVLEASGWGRSRGFAPLTLPSLLRMIATILIAVGIAVQVAQVVGRAASDLLVQIYFYGGLGMAAFGLLLLEQLFRCATDDSRWNIKPLAIALGAGFAFDIYLKSSAILFLRQDADAFAVRGVAHLLVLPLLLLFISRSRTRRISVSLSKSAIFHTTTLAAIGIYLVATAAAGYYIRYLGGSWGGALRLTLLFGALVFLALLALSGTVRARFRVFVGKHFFRYRYDYREEWVKFTEALSSEAASDAVGLRVVRALADMVESPAGGLWVLDPRGKHYVMSTRWNFPPCAEVEPANDQLAVFLRSTQWVLDLEDFRLRPGRYNDLVLPGWLTELPNAWLVLPLRMHGELSGFVVLTTARVPLDVNWEVNDLLKTASLQAAAFLAQVQATEALLEARKFDAFNRMSAFVVHDLKNIVAQLSLLLRNAERHSANVDFQRDMISTIRHSVDKMRQLMLQLREGVKPTEGSGWVDLSEIVARVMKAKTNAFPGIELAIRDHLLTRGHAERIERVLGHLVQNAVDATPSNGRIWVNVKRDGGHAVVEVCDTGAGMTEEFLREKLFRPFNSTKEAGMGIGAYESMHYIQELGGKITARSSPGEGSCFTVTLPLLEAGRVSGLVDREKT